VKESSEEHGALPLRKVLDLIEARLDVNKNGE
jgi:hypothetical protein